MSNPIFFWTVDPIIILVTGIISFFIILSVLNGRIALGILKLRFPPNSNRLKKESLGSPISFDAPIELLRLNERFSVPLKIFLILKFVPNEIPKSSILECVKSKSKPKLNLSLGKRYIDEERESLFSSKIILGYLNAPKLEKYLDVNSFFSSL